MRVRNTHSAAIDDLAPGAIGDVDENNPGVRVMLGTLLQPCDEQGVTMPAAVASELDAAKARIAELEAALAAASNTSVDKSPRGRANRDG